LLVIPAQAGTQCLALVALEATQCIVRDEDFGIRRNDDPMAQQLAARFSA